MNDSQAIFSQRDTRWARQKIGRSVITIGGYGCTLTSVCRSLFLLTGKLLNPSQMEDSLLFTSDGLLIWSSFEKVGLKAILGWGKPKEFEKGMILALDYRASTGIMHWVTFDSLGPDGKTVKVMDPWVGEIVSKPISLITSFTEVVAVDGPLPEPTEWEKEIAEATAWVKEHGISNGLRPKEFVTREELWVNDMRLAKKIMEWVENK